MLEVGDGIISGRTSFVVEDKVLVPEFEFDGGGVYLGAQEVVRGETEVDFSGPVVLTVRSKGGEEREYRVSLVSFTGLPVVYIDTGGIPDVYKRQGHTLLYDEDDATANLAVTSVTELYASIFDWLKAHDVNAAVIIVIMLVVAFFNMTSELLILVLERTRMIGLLKAFGMRNGQLRQVFLWRASFITLRGLAWGNAVGLGLCLSLIHIWVLIVRRKAVRGDAIGAKPAPPPP